MHRYLMPQRNWCRRGCMQATSISHPIPPQHRLVLRVNAYIRAAYVPGLGIEVRGSGSLHAPVFAGVLNLHTAKFLVQLHHLCSRVIHVYSTRDYIPVAVVVSKGRAQHRAV